MVQPKKLISVAGNKHASAQDRYHKNKMLTHKKICRWVPQDRVIEFVKEFERMKKKWTP